jgi:hypothetical protein
MIYHIDLRVGGLEWVQHLFRELITLANESDEDITLEAKAALGLASSIDPRLLQADLKEATRLSSLIVKSDLKEVASLDLDEEWWEEEVRLLEADLEAFKIGERRVEDRLGRILDLQYELVDRLLVFTFATIYDSYLSGGIEGKRGNLLKGLLNKFWYFGYVDHMPDAAMSIGHLDHMLREHNASPLQEAIKNLTSRVRWDLL